MAGPASPREQLPRGTTSRRPRRPTGRGKPRTALARPGAPKAQPRPGEAARPFSVSGGAQTHAPPETATALSEGEIKVGVSRPISRVLSGGLPPRRPFIWGAACAAPRATNPGGGRDRAWNARSEPRTSRAAPIRSCSRWGLPCRLRCRRRGALLPHRFTLAVAGCPARAVSSLWHFPWGHPRRPLAATANPWSPDFPPPRAYGRKAGSRGSGRPAG